MPRVTPELLLRAATAVRSPLASRIESMVPRSQPCATLAEVAAHGGVIVFANARRLIG